ncbi:hypothetical protein Rsub_10058 [Raphidocelis subcapitata]|uniref:cellulase n=1 Tax=Raphidocelis subcapitata TaxID=307507 RepID=A0A2V0PIR2_9CHLO|nr:hypothetical protein Rsub_10058 [Raphidocelis subcapitata]|eukprot:GBF97197.1 hypothetical protein Rsub_10058 [Raphidocelis subcapitata]
MSKSCQASYLTDARYWAARHAAEEADPTLPGSWAFNYNNAGWGAEVLLAEAPDGEAARLRVAQFLRAWIDGKNDYGDILLVTKRGLAYLPADTTGGAEREPLPHAAAAALAALAHAAGPGGAALPRAARARLECFALGQITYMLGGQVGRNRGYLTGFGPRAPLAPRQMASSCPPGSRGRSPPACSVPALLGGDPNPSPLAGALVAGPGEDDSYTDARAAPGAGVGVHYNAPLLAALAGLLQSNAGPGQCQGAGGGILRELLSVN